MLDFGFLQNLDLLSVAAAIATIGVLGSVVLLHDTSSATNRAVFYFAMAAAFWSIFNYLYYQPFDAALAIWLLRIHAFFAVWYTFSLFYLFYTFPSAEPPRAAWFRYILLPTTAAISVLSLTPYTFRRITGSAVDAGMSGVTQGPAIVIFGATIVSLVIAGFILVTRKYIRTRDERTGQNLGLIIIGGVATFILHIVFNLTLPALLGDTRFVPFGAVFIFPFIATVSYAILRNRLFDIKVAGVSLLVVALALSSFVEVILTVNNPYLLIFRGSVFLLILSFGTTLIQGVLREVKQREEIERLSEDKSEFMTFASHEIRNPITAMRGYASLIVDGTAGEASAPVRDAARRILIEGNDVLHLIAQYLSKSKLELGKIQYLTAPFDLGATVSGIVDAYAPHAAQTGVRIEQRIDLAHKFTIVADESKVKEVISNLIDNSFKYTKEGVITVSVARHGVSIRVEVADTGVGIAPEVMPQLFKKFSRADAQRANLLGTGIGLYLAKTFTDAMGGRIWAESAGVGKGSRFIVEFSAST